MKKIGRTLVWVLLLVGLVVATGIAQDIARGHTPWDCEHCQ